MLRPLLEVEMAKVHAIGREAHVQVKMLKAPHVRTTFGNSMVVLRGMRSGFCTLPKLSKTQGVESRFKYNHQYATLHSIPLHYNCSYKYHDTDIYCPTLH